MEQIKCYCGHTTYCDCGPLEENLIEEAAEEFAKNHSIYPTAQDDTEYGFKHSAKWMQEQNNTLYVVTAYRWGDIEQHGYVVGVYSSHENATNASKIEYINRGGKYECQITEHELNFIETYYDKTD